MIASASSLNIGLLNGRVAAVWVLGIGPRQLIIKGRRPPTACVS